MAAVDGKGSVAVVDLVVEVDFVVVVIMVVLVVIVVGLVVASLVMKVSLVYNTASALSVILACAPKRKMVDTISARSAMVVAFFVIIHPLFY